MKISYNWLKDYVHTDLSPDDAGKLLTGCGLEVESIETFETVKGGLRGMVIGEVKTKEKHPDADKLSLTTVDIGTGELLSIVCGAPNVAAGQKVVVATVGAKLYPATGEPFEIKKSKIRGAVSEGMLCAEDEIGLGESHAGIMVLDPSAKVGAPAAEYFSISEDHTFEIGLTPNRADAASHVGVARDLAAVLQCMHAKDGSEIVLKMPEIRSFRESSEKSPIEVSVEDSIACPRYSALVISDVRVAESPEWLSSRLKAIGVRPINNIVDITNYVLHELGQPLHAFDADAIRGKKVIVKKPADNTPFTTLDSTARKLSSEDLMICDAEGGICIAGVFGGLQSGISKETKTIFLESAYFNPTSIRKTSKRHGLKTDASFRFERGTDPNMTVFVLKRAALLIQEIAGGKIASETIDLYPHKIENHKVPFSFEKCDRLIGKHIDIELVKSILKSLEIEIEHEGHDALLLSVPPFKVDVTREQDVIEEVLRIYGYNNIEVPQALKSSLSFSEKPGKERIQNVISDLLSSNRFVEMMGLSLTKEEYAGFTGLDAGHSVKMLNPLSSDLNVMRQTMLFSGLEAVAYNINRKSSDLRLFEFGKTYMALKSEGKSRYIEDRHLSMFLTGKKDEESWSGKTADVNFYTLRGFLEAVFERLGIETRISDHSSPAFAYSLAYYWNKRQIAEAGAVSRQVLKEFDIRQEVFYADVNWDLVLEILKNAAPVLYSEVSKFPEVRRDLAMLIDKSVRFDQLEQLAYQSEKNILKSVNLFDVYEGDKLPEGKKSYALSFTLQDENATLTDKQIEKIMEKLIRTFREKAGAEIRDK